MKQFAMCFGILAFLGASAKADVVFNAAADFSTTSNPNGVWTSGYTASLGSAFQAFNTNLTAGSLNIWYSSVIGSPPEFGKNISSSTFQGIAPGQLTMHPGNAGQYAALRFTAPTDGVYTIASQFFAGDIGDTDAHVLLNGNAGSPLFAAASTNGSPTYNDTRSLTAGDRLDFVVGWKGDFSFDSTPVDVQLTLVPEPAVLALAGIAGCTVALRRRK